MGKTLEALRQACGLGVGPALVMASAPSATVPEGYGDGWALFCMNGSQAVGARFGLPRPDVALLRGRLFEGKQVDREAVAVLQDGHARLVLVQNLDAPLSGIEAHLADLNYRYDRIRKLEDVERKAVIYAAYANPLSYLLYRRSISAGVVSAMMALAIGRAPVVLTGVSLTTGGHFYSSSNLPRSHIDQDRKALQIMARRNLPLFTTDIQLAELTGLRVWGKAQGR